MHPDLVALLNQTALDAAAASPELPVGYILTSGEDVNPRTFLRYGTWTSVGSGRISLALDAGGADSVLIYLWQRTA